MPDETPTFEEVLRARLHAVSVDFGWVMQALLDAKSSGGKVLVTTNSLESLAQSLEQTHGLLARLVTPEAGQSADIAARLQADREATAAELKKQNEAATEKLNSATPLGGQT